MSTGRTKKGKFPNKADRQRVVERLLLAGLSTAGIAEELGFSERTIQNDAQEIRERWESPLDYGELTTWSLRAKKAFAELCLEQAENPDIQASVRQAFLASGLKLMGELEDLLKLKERLEMQQESPNLLERLQGIWMEKDEEIERLEVALRERGLSDDEIEAIRNDEPLEAAPLP